MYSWARVRVISSVGNKVGLAEYEGVPNLGI